MKLFREKKGDENHVKKEVENPEYTLLFNIDELENQLPMIKALPQVRAVLRFCKENDLFVIIKDGNIHYKVLKTKIGETSNA